MRALTAATRQRLREGVTKSAFGEDVLDFLESVVQLAAHPLGEPSRSGDEAHEIAIADRVMQLLDAAVADVASVANASVTLARDPALLGALFQSLDLLPVEHPAADSIALLVGMALSRLDEIEGDTDE